MKYLYSFSVPELKITLKACLDYKASKVCSAEENHALDSIIDYCQGRLNEFESIDVKQVVRCGWRDKENHNDLGADK